MSFVRRRGRGSLPPPALKLRIKSFGPLAFPRTTFGGSVSLFHRGHELAFVRACTLQCLRPFLPSIPQTVETCLTASSVCLSVCPSLASDPSRVSLRLLLHRGPLPCMREQRGRIFRATTTTTTTTTTRGESLRLGASGCSITLNRSSSARRPSIILTCPKTRNLR